MVPRELGVSSVTEGARVGPKPGLSEIESEGARTWFLYALVFTVGTATLGCEIAAARLIAPFFGASTIVWANTIAVVLVSLALGYWLGGRIADRYPHLRGLCLVVLVAAAILAVVPFASQPFFDVSVDALDSIEAGAFVGSLLAVLVLLAVPLVLLGACSPYAVRLAVPDVEHSGTVAGRLFAVSTAGSLLGTMLAALVTIPFLGTRLSFLLFAFSIAVMASIGLGRWAWVGPAAILALAAIPQGVVKQPASGEKVLWEGDTEAQYARVIGEADGDRRLELNEGVAQHSVWRPDSYLTNGNYWDGLLVLPFATERGAPQRVAILGNAAGTSQRSFAHFFPGVEVDGVEIDPELTELGRRYFDLRTAPDLRVHHADARPWLRASEGDFDLIIVDAYRQPYIPFYLTTKEFFELVADRLAPGGMAVVNVGHPEGNDDLERVVTAGMATAFRHVKRDAVTETNTLVMASQEEITGERLLEALPAVPEELRNQAAIEATRISAALRGGEVYTDDRAPVEWLIDRSIVGYATGG